ALKRAEADYEERVIRPMLAAARTCNDWMKVVGEVLALERQRQLLSSGEPDAAGSAGMARMWELYETGIEVCYEEFYRKCVTEHDLGQISLMISLESDLQLFGRRGEDDPFDPRLHKCATFELEFETQLTMKMDIEDAPVHAPFEVGGRSRVEKVSLFGGGGSAPLELTAAVAPRIDLGGGQGVECKGTLQGLSGAVLEVRRIDGELKHPPVDPVTRLPTGKAEALMLEIDVDFGEAAGTITNSCTVTMKRDGGGFQTFAVPTPPAEVAWPALLRTAHAADDHGGVIRFRFEQSAGEIPGGTLFARKSFTEPVPHPHGPGVIEERTVLMLWHRPGGS
nr:hypothetical protein [Gemmatimonadota bacterium]